MSETKTLVKKLCEIMACIERVEKRGKNAFHNYKYATETDLAEAIRPELVKRNVFIFPSMVSHERKEYVSDKGKKSQITDVVIKWTIEDGDSGESRELLFPGCGEDSGDKGVYKAITGSEKYLLMKSFLIPTGDDPENDSSDLPKRPYKQSSGGLIGETDTKTICSATVSDISPPDSIQVKKLGAK